MTRAYLKKDSFLKTLEILKKWNLYLFVCLIFNVKLLLVSDVTGDFNYLLLLARCRKNTARMLEYYFKMTNGWHGRRVTGSIPAQEKHLSKLRMKTCPKSGCLGVCDAKGH